MYGPIQACSNCCTHGGAIASVGAPTQAGGTKVDVCHSEGNGDFHLINISENAFDTHVGHGDDSPGGAVPGMDGYEFDADCVPVESVAILFEAMAFGSLVQLLDTDGSGLPSVGDTITSPWGGCAVGSASFGARYHVFPNNDGNYLDRYMSVAGGAGLPHFECGQIRGFQNTGQTSLVCFALDFGAPLMSTDSRWNCAPATERRHDVPLVTVGVALAEPPLRRGSDPRRRPGRSKPGGLDGRVANPHISRCAMRPGQERVAARLGAFTHSIMCGRLLGCFVAQFRAGVRVHIAG
jgi:hypothetical protein